MQKIRPECGDSAADLVAHYIGNEISGFRSGVYRLPEGKPEPRKLMGLFATSPLRAVCNYLVSQARFGDYVPEPYAVTFALRALSKRFTKPIPPMDWSCLTSFFHLSFDARKYCIMLAKNQALHSGTARRLLENFLADFEPNCFEEDLLLLFSLLPEIGNSVSLHILKNFAEKVAVYCFKESQLNDFAEGESDERSSFMASTLHSTLQAASLKSSWIASSTSSWANVRYPRCWMCSHLLWSVIWTQ